MAVNCSDTRLNISWMAVVLPRKVKERGAGEVAAMARVRGTYHDVLRVEHLLGELPGAEVVTCYPIATEPTSFSLWSL